MPATLDRAFSDYLLRCFDDPQQFGVHQLFNEWWRFAPEETIRGYVAQLERMPDWEGFVGDGWFAEPTTVEALASYPDGSLGRSYHDFLVANGLEKNLAINYHAFHRHLEGQGKLDAMPAPLRYAILRGFQVHDYLHVVTGCDSSPRGELALQAFCLAQLQFPYFGMWMSVVTARMTYLQPETIVPVMDAITAGWSAGRATPNLQFERWEERLSEPLTALRAELALPASGVAALPH